MFRQTLAAAIAATTLFSSTFAAPTTKSPADVNLDTRQNVAPCVAMAQAQAKFAAAYPKLALRVPADVAYNCLITVPVQAAHSLRILNGMKPWFEVQSTVDYIKYPPTGYLFDSLDLIAQIDVIIANINNKKYRSQYDVEADISAMILGFRDFHITFQGDLLGTAYWNRYSNLVSISSDGQAVPQIYLTSDVFTVTPQDTFAYTANLQAVSAVKSINGMPVQQFLQTQMLETNSHDPDSMYNTLFYSMAQTANPGQPGQSTYINPTFYPGGQTVFTFQNGSTFTEVVDAFTPCTTMSSVKDGQTYWNSCVTAQDNVAGPPSATSTNTGQADEAKAATTTPPAVTKLSGYPKPVAIDEQGVMSGYFLAGNGNDDTAVLVIRMFEAGQGVSDYMPSFQNTLQSFLTQCKSANKKKLILDLQGNGGGYIDLGTELLAQLFPHTPPNAAADMRSSLGYSLVLQKVAKLLARDDSTEAGNTLEISETSNYYQPFAWQSVMKPDGVSDFTSFNDFYGPHSHGHGTFTSFFQTNYTNLDPSQKDAGFIQITGYGARTNTGPQTPVFAASNIVILSDGFCGSTCSNVYELLTGAHSITAITVGGRPQTGPSQTVGNTKGSQVFRTEMDDIVSYYLDPTPSNFPIDRTAMSTTVFRFWEKWTRQHGLTGVNAKNNFRFNDATTTPLQFVYAASDCRFFLTGQMIADPSVIWTQTAAIAFDTSRKAFGAAGGPYTSNFCIPGSTGQSTSVTGGVNAPKGGLGSQIPPQGAKPGFLGWLVNGASVTKAFSPANLGGNTAGTNTVTVSGVTSASSVNNGATTGNGNGGSAGEEENGGSVESDVDQVKSEMQNAIGNLKNACSGYSGEKWLVSLVCGAFT